MTTTGERQGAWSPEQAAKAVGLKADGKTTVQVAAIMGLSVNACRKRLNALGVANEPRRRWGEEKIARLKEMWADGVSSTIIGPTLGVSPGAARRQARWLKLDKRRFGGLTSGSGAVHRLPGIISATLAPVAYYTIPAPKVLPPLRVRILDTLSTGPSDTLSLSSACEAKELTVSQELSLLESEGRVVQSPCPGLRSKSWRLVERAAA